MRIDIVGLKDALERNVGVWEVKAEEAERLAARLEAFDPASLGLEGEGYSALRERVTSHAPFAKSQASLLRSLSEGCARNLDAAALLEPSEPDGSVDTDHLSDELSRARSELDEGLYRHPPLLRAGHAPSPGPSSGTLESDLFEGGGWMASPSRGSRGSSTPTSSSTVTPG